MQLFLDSAITDEIRHALEIWDVDGFTTNPRHVQASGKPLRRLLDEIAGLVAGTDKPVSVEVNPRLTDWRQIVDEALSLAAISPNFVVKVGASESGLRAVRELAGRGVRTNVTLVFSAAQAWHAARTGANYVSPFLGWKEAHGDECRTLLPEIMSLLRNYGYKTRVIAAALRNARQIGEAAIAGAHCATAGFTVIQDSFRHPFTTMGEDLFGAAWDATPREVPGKSS
ncbi:MAG TPA: transaldolase family protein [Gemmataceae bacterium]|jgi:transaldolase|nr:transaldolase family protein [Gemmataceae bacterium]